MGMEIDEQLKLNNKKRKYNDLSFNTNKKVKFSDFLNCFFERIELDVL